MRRFFLAAAMGLFVAQAGAAGTDAYTPEFKAYTSFSFGGTQQQSLGLHYGFRMDHDSREASLLGAQRPAIAQVDFSQSSGFEGASIYGMPLSNKSFEMMNLAEPGVGGKLLWFGSFFLLGGAIYGIHEAAKDDSAPQTCTNGSKGPFPACPIDK